MYLKKVEINQYGCIKRFIYEPKFSESGQPKPIILIGKNGTGKTLALINILESLVQLKVEKNKDTHNALLSYKKEKKDYIQSGTNYSYVDLTFRDDEDKKESNYIELAVLDRNEFLASIDDITKFKSFDKFDSNFVRYGHFKKIMDDTKKDMFEKNIFLYFPVHRYYQPSWQQKEQGSLKLNFYDEEVEMDANIVKVNVLHDIEQWILDLILDRYLYESKFKVRQITEEDDKGKYIKKNITEHLGFQGKNDTTISLLNHLLTILYRKKYKNFEYARLGISKKEKRKVSIIVKQKNGPEIQLAPTFSHLSSGEAMLISLFGSILKQYDLINDTGAKTLEEIKGIVLIDEVDLNLNLEYAKEIVPELISAFKGIQFIVSTHSPFFLLGMKDLFNENCEFVHMPNGALYDGESSFEQVRKSYTMFLKDVHELEG